MQCLLPKIYLCYPYHCRLLLRVHSQTLLHLFHLDKAHPSCSYQPSQQNMFISALTTKHVHISPHNKTSTKHVHISPHNKTCSYQPSQQNMFISALTTKHVHISPHNKTCSYQPSQQNMFISALTTKHPHKSKHPTSSSFCSCYRINCHPTAISISLKPTIIGRK